MRGESPRVIKSDETPTVAGEIGATSPESEIAVDLKGTNALDEWLVFVDEEIKEISQSTKDAIDIQGKANEEILNLREFTNLLGKTMEETKKIDIEILGSLEKLNEANKE